MRRCCVCVALRPSHLFAVRFSRRFRVATSMAISSLAGAIRAARAEAGSLSTALDAHKTSAHTLSIMAGLSITTAGITLGGRDGATVVTSTHPIVLKGWKLASIGGRPISDIESALHSARRLGRPYAVTFEASGKGGSFAQVLADAQQTARREGEERREAAAKAQQKARREAAAKARREEEERARAVAEEEARKEAAQRKVEAEEKQAAARKQEEKEAVARKQAEDAPSPQPRPSPSPQPSP